MSLEPFELCALRALRVRLLYKETPFSYQYNPDQRFWKIDKIKRSERLLMPV